MIDSFLLRRETVFSTLLTIILGLIFFFTHSLPEVKTNPSDSVSYEQILLDKDPKAALLALQTDLSEKKDITNNCHPLAHKLGRLGFQKYQSYEQAALYQDPVCNSGYIHGVIEARLQGSENISADMQQLCKGPFSSIFAEWQCFHGLGHGAMYYSNNNLPLSLQYCLSLKDINNQASCANGVYMENFVSENDLHPSAFVKDSEPFYPCTDSSFPFNSTCTYYAPTRMLKLNGNNYSEVYALCTQISDPDQRRSCVSGVSGQALKDSYANPKQVEKLCASFAESDQQICIEGILDMFVNMQGTTHEGKAYCNSLESQNQKTCFDELEFKKRELNT